MLKVDNLPFGPNLRLLEANFKNSISAQLNTKKILVIFCVCLFVFVCFVALRPKSTAMVMAGRSVHLTTLFPGQA